MRKIFYCLFIMVFVSIWNGRIVTGNPNISDEEKWFDTYYQYHIPVTLEVKEPGWQCVPITESQITSAINKLEELQFNSQWFAYNQLKIIEIDNDGKAIGLIPTAGFYLIPVSEELIKEKLTSDGQEIEIPIEKETYYLARYKSESGGESPLRNYAASSYQPPLLPQKLTTHECLLISDVRPLVIRDKYAWATDVKEISLKKVKIVFLADIKEPGKKKWMLYYQPMSGQSLSIPQLRHFEIPARSANIKQIEFAEKYIGKTKYSLGSNDYFNTWFAETTVKLTPNTPVPAKSSQSIEIACAKNELQSFQIIINPKKSFEFRGIDITDLENGDNKIPSENISVYAIDYVTIRKKSEFTPTPFLGEIGDPLVSLSSKKLSPVDGNSALWITVRTHKDTPAGIYKGWFTIQADGTSISMTIPLTLTVYDFDLPEFSTLQSNLGGQFFLKGSGKTLFDFHGLKTKEELKKLTRKYYDVMAINKFYPKSVVLYSEIGMNWSPPPEGYNVDKPGNYFKLSGWDFTEFNKELEHYINNLKVNSVCLTHTNPRVSNMFKDLPSTELKEFNRDPPHVAMAWQTFRECTFVEWGKRQGERPNVIEITQGQFDHLVLDYYRTIARNLEEHGWLDYFYILIDETSDVERILHLLRLLKSDPLTARLKVVACIQSFEYFQHKEKPDDKKYAFNGLLTYMPQIDETYNRWEKYYFTDYDIIPERNKLWCYIVGGSRLSIDAPGINNRVIGLDLFNRGAGGFHISDTIWWDEKGEAQNPWDDPSTRWGNGVYAYFYPPKKDGPSEEPDYTIIPSLRVMTYRESVDDYEYARILEDLIMEGEEEGIDVSEGRVVFKDVERFFYNSVHWSQNDAWYLELRRKMAKIIIDLRNNLAFKK